MTLSQDTLQALHEAVASALYALRPAVKWMTKNGKTTNHEVPWDEASVAQKEDAFDEARRVLELPEILTLIAERDAWDWLANNPDHQLSYEGWEDNEWHIHRVTGPRSDREWKLVGTGPTPLAAIQDAIERGDHLSTKGVG